MVSTTLFDNVMKRVTLTAKTWKSSYYYNNLIKTILFYLFTSRCNSKCEHC